MTTTQIITALAALAVAGWPSIKPAASWLSGLLKVLPRPTGPVQPVEPATTYQGAMGSLAVVRARLKVTGCLNDDESAAIDVLTLALVAGSDK